MLEIQGARHMGRKLFAELDLIDDADERSLRFHDFMDVTFQLSQVFTRLAL